VARISDRWKRSTRTAWATTYKRGPSENQGSLEDWAPNKGRRCLTVEEMESGSFQARQFVRNGRGRWSLEKRLNRSRKSFQIKLPSPERPSQSLGATQVGETLRPTRDLAEASR
jgi:hypothetical protein